MVDAQFKPGVIGVTRVGRHAPNEVCAHGKTGAGRRTANDPPAVDDAGRPIKHGDAVRAALIGDCTYSSIIRLFESRRQALISIHPDVEVTLSLAAAIVGRAAHDRMHNNTSERTGS